MCIIYIYNYIYSSSSSIWSIQPNCCKIGKDWVIVGQEDNIIISMNTVWFCMMVDSVVPDLTVLIYADLCWSMLIYADLLNLYEFAFASSGRQGRRGSMICSSPGWSSVSWHGAHRAIVASSSSTGRVEVKLNAPTISSGSLKAWKLCDIMWYFVVKLEEWINECSLQFYMQLNSAPIACSMHRNLEQARYIYSLYLITVIGKVAQTAGKTPNIGFHFSWAKPCKDCFPKCAKPIK